MKLQAKFGVIAALLAALLVADVLVRVVTAQGPQVTVGNVKLIAIGSIPTGGCALNQLFLNTATNGLSVCPAGSPSSVFPYRVAFQAATYSASSGTVPLFTNSGATGKFRVGAYLWVTATGTAGTVSCTFTANNGTFGVTHTLASSINLTALNDVQGIQDIVIGSGQAITYSCPYASPTGTPATAIDVDLEQVQ